MTPAKRSGEFEIIAELFAPLSKGEPGAFALTDDAAALKPKPGHDIVLTTDAIVAGIHFLPDDPAGTIAQKALRVNLSDLAAKGAKPRAYMLTAVLPETTSDVWLKAFAEGLKHDQKKFGLTLIGGDTVATPGPLTLSVVAIGEVAQGKMLRRAHAKAGDDIWVTGTIGDAALGLRVLRADGLGLSERHNASLVARYRVPEPRVAAGQTILNVAHACLDVSDGLVADCGHMAEASKVGIELRAADIPLSPAAQSAVANGLANLADLLTAGDDYELVFAAAPTHRARLTALGAKLKTRFTRIGKAVKGKGMRVYGPDSAPMAFDRTGFAHF
jgi:thiamine-monophosphate kinase